MSWLRVDDGFTDHPKIVALGTPAKRWTWLRILTYTARYRSPHVPAALREIIAEATPKYLQQCVEIGLIDVADDGSMSVHDWLIYNAGTIAEKVAVYLSSNPEASANQVYKALGGTREIVLGEVARQRATGSESGSATDTGTGSAEPPHVVRKGGSESGSRARGPSPAPDPNPVSSKAEEQSAAAANDTTWPNREDPVVRLLATMRHKDGRTEHVLRSFVGKVPDAAFDYTRDELERTRETTEHDAKLAVHVLNRIRREGTLATPTAPATNGNGEKPHVDPAERRQRFVHGDGWRLPADELEHQLVQMGADEDELVGLLEWAADRRSAET
jgi:hypothetical protein